MTTDYRRRPHQPDTEEMEEEAQLPVSTLPIPRARHVNTNLPVPTAPVHTRRRFRISKPVWGILVGMLVALALWIVLQQIVMPWWNGIQDQWHGGDGRITQFDANVGHGGVSHFVAQYYHGSIVVLEISQDNPNTMHVYRLPALDPNATTPPTLTLTVEKINHRLDLVIQTEGSGAALILYNTGTAFSVSEE